jgi:microcystin-dependent protein
MTPITALPTPPSRQDPVNFAVRGDAFMAALPAFATEVNTLAGEVEAAAATAAAGAAALAASTTLAVAVQTSGDQTVGGIKTFTSLPVLPSNASTSMQAVPKQQAESIAVAGGAPGAVSHFAMTSAPTGWLKANGASLSTTTYAVLFGAIGYAFGGSGGSFKLPDLRGEFIRSLDDSRGIDTGRGLGTAQSDQNKAHTHGAITGYADTDHIHGATTSSDGTHQHYYTMQNNGNNAYPGPSGNYIGDAKTSTLTAPGEGSHNHTINVGGMSASHRHTIASDGGTEVRVRNVALLACIKY